MCEMLLQAIKAQPDDDLVRLACADWLEEQGNIDHGRFIRLQVEQGRAPAASPAICSPVPTGFARAVPV